MVYNVLKVKLICYVIIEELYGYGFKRGVRLNDFKNGGWGLKGGGGMII